MTSDTAWPRAVLWDMDGTLVDTEPYWMRAERELAARFGREWSDADGLRMVGNGLWESARILREHGVDLEDDAIVATLTARVVELLSTGPLPWRPGALELLGGLHRAGVPCALVTMSLSSMARAVEGALGFDAFRLLVTGDAVTRPKPHPEAYLRAAEALGLAPAECIAIEDSPGGLASANAAGTIALGVPHVLPLPEEGGHTLWPTLEGRTVADLAALAAGRTAVAG